MSDDEFSTLNIKRQQMARELEDLRQRYLEHHAAITRLEQDSPSELLAARYRDVRLEIERSLAKVDEMAAPPARAASGMPAPVLPPTPPPRVDPGQREILQPILPSINEGDFDPNETIARRSAPRPVRSASTEVGSGDTGGEDSGRRLLLIALVTLLVLGILGALAYQFSRKARPGEAVVVEAEQSSTAPVVEPEATGTTPVELEEAPASAISISPPVHDFGAVRKGTRAIRQFSIENSSSAPVDVKIDRSKCRCLWFDYDARIPAKSSAILAVTVDGAKAKAGQLEETLGLTAGDSKARFKIRASIE